VPSAPLRGKVESASIPQALRKRVEDAVEVLGGRVTVGDVAGRAGVSLEDTERTLNALAADSQGVLQVRTFTCAVINCPSDIPYTFVHSSGYCFSDCEAHLVCVCHAQVSDAGDVLYVLPQNFKAIIQGRSVLLKLEPALARAKAAAGYVVRVSFGSALVASIVLVSLTIIAILTAASSSDRDDRR
jgi:hypothetical protein